MKKAIKKKIISIILFIIASVFALQTTMFAQAGISSEAEEHILNELRRAGIPNPAVAVVQGDETTFILKDSELDTLFEIASVTKPITAYGVLLLEDMGLLSVHDPVNMHLHWFQVNYSGAPVPHEDITIYHLIHHTSGIAQNESRFPRAASTETMDEFITRLAGGMELDFYPATNVAYSNMAYIILGLLIEAVSEQSYDEFMTQQVLHPLGMYNTYTNTQRARATEQNASGHKRGFLQVRQGSESVFDHVANMPAGSIYSSVADLALWAQIQLGTVDVPPHFARVVERSHTLRNDSDTVIVDDSGMFAGYFFSGGWYVNAETGHIEHGGTGMAGWSTLIRIHPENNTAVVFLSNLRLWISGDNMASMPLNAVVYGNFTSLGRDWNVWIDLLFTLLCVWGVVCIGLFMRLLMKVRKRLRDGEVIKFNFSAIGIKGSLGLVYSVAGLIFYYIFPYVLMDSTRESLLNNWVTSFGVAAIFIWITALYDVFTWWVKVSVKPGRV